MTTGSISPDLKTILRRLKLSRLLDTLPERLTLAGVGGRYCVGIDYRRVSSLIDRRAGSLARKSLGYKGRRMRPGAYRPREYCDPRDRSFCADKVSRLRRASTL